VVAILQTSMIAASLAVLVYIAVVVTGDFLTPDIVPINGGGGASNTLQTSIGQTTTTNDTSIREQIAAAADYLHTFDTSTVSDTILLNGVTLQSGEPLLIYDSTPFASKGHLAMNVPCNENTPENAVFEILFGRAPNLSPVKPGYLSQISAPPNNCIYHAQFGFGDPVTDIAIRYIGENQTTFRGSNSLVISTHESYIPITPSEKEMEHEQ
jgi:hypothetical protein